MITSKLARLAVMHLEHLGLEVDEVHGDVFAAQKAAVLRAVGAAGYVGDHVADMHAAVLAGIPGMGLTSGPCSRDELFAAGASRVADDLYAFEDWFGTLISVGRTGGG